MHECTNFIAYQVRTDSRNGIGTFLSSPRPAAFCLSPAALAKADIHLPRVERDLLMFAPSFNRAPVAPVELALSDPAKSTKHNLHLLTALQHYWTPHLNHLMYFCKRYIIYFFPFVRVLWKRMIIVKTEWEREDSLFMFVEAVVLCSSPISRRYSTSL